MFDKKEIFRVFKNNLEEKILNLTDEALAQQEAATNEESKAENKYDTRGLEASYIAQAHAGRISEMKEGLYFLTKTEIKPFKNKIKVGDLITLMDLNSKSRSHFFILPTGGIETMYGEYKIRSLSPLSPMGRKILGLDVDDEFKLNKKEYVIEDAL